MKGKKTTTGEKNNKAMDFLQIVLGVGITALVVCLASAIFVAWQNASSRNLALAAGTLGAAMVLFLIQLPFELRRSTTYNLINAELTVDRAKPQIRQWKYDSDTPPWRLSAEVEASSWLAVQEPLAFQRDREKLTTDLVLFSLAFFLQTEHYWEVRKLPLLGKTGSGVIKYRPSPQRQCRIVNEADLKAQLSRSGNAFAGAPLFNRSICLPPDSELHISANSLVIRNRVCQLSFTLEPSGRISYDNPGTGELPKLPNGEPSLETRGVGLDVETIFFALRAQHKDREKYQEWATRVISGARDWFEK